MGAQGEAVTVVELHQGVRVISKRDKGERSEADSRAVAITAAGQDSPLLPCNTARSGVINPVARNSSGADGNDWLVAITVDGNERLKCIETRKKPRIQRAPSYLRQGNTKFFEPEVVSLGPYYHGAQGKFAAMEDNKRAAAARFAREQTGLMSVFYDMVKSVAGAARECYAEKFDNINEEDFANMMFVDGCFILHFIDCCMNGAGTTSPTTKAHLGGFIIRDMFLLENQVPFVVLQALMSLRPVKYKEFVRKITGDMTSMESSEEAPAHLLDLLRTELLGREVVPKNQQPREANWQSFRSVMELREMGIKFSKSRTSCLRDVGFSEGHVYGHLHLPPMVVDDMVRPKFLNLVALEMCPDGNYDYGVTSYICFLDSLIDHADDVKELRRRRILLNGLGSDQQAADLFNELTTGLSPEHFAYEDTIAKINQHCRNKKKVSFARLYHTHFGSPWTTISFFAAVFLILLTTAQTFFAIFPKFASDKS